MRMCRPRPLARLLAAVGVLALLLTVVSIDLGAQALSPDLAKTFKFRSIGPSRQSGRFVDFAVPEKEPWTIYAATGSGGLWKSVNNGTSWEPIFDNEAVISIGDIAVSASDPKIVWVGTGEHTSSRSTYWGDGIYKSIDAGKTWVNMGLKNSQHIGRVLVDPKDPNIVYVAALGALYSQNDERGVYKTIDGGKTWTRSLEVKADGRMVGAADLAMDPVNSRILYAATYDKERKPWTFNLAGPGGGIYKTVDAGKTWTKLAGGLPGGMLGRIGIDIYKKNPLILYANIENGNKPGMSDADRLAELRAGKSSDGMIGEEVYRSDDGGKTWKKVNEKLASGRGAMPTAVAQAPGDAQAQQPPQPARQGRGGAAAPAAAAGTNVSIGGGPGYYYMQIRVDPNDAGHVYVLTVGVLESKDGGKTWTSPFRFGGDNHAMWIDPANSNHMLLGYDHGMGITYDGGKNWYHPDELPLAQFYQVGFDYQMPYNVAGGLQDNGSVRGPSTKRSGGRIVFEDWQTVGGGDGMYNVTDANNRFLYNESQQGSISRVDLYTGESKGIRYADNTLRYAWTAPILLSPHDPATVYHGANVLLKSTNRGDTWTVVSPDLSNNDKTKLIVPPPPAVGKGGDGNIQYQTITSIDESALVRDLLYVGTDDGNVWVSKDGGKNWTKLNDKIAGNPGYYVSRVIASRHAPGTAYVSYTGLRNDDFRAFLYKTTDFGATWASVTGNLPARSVNVVREDPYNPNLLFVGVDWGVYVSLDGGKNWTELKNGMPTQPVHDLQVHPREHELIVATHGRGIFITDISALEEMSGAVLGQDFYLFDVTSKVKWVTRRENVSASINYAGQSAPNGILINYYLKGPAQGDVVVKVMQGSWVLAETKGPNAAGINQVLWNMRGTLATAPGVTASAGGRGGRGGGAGAGGLGGGRGGQQTPLAYATFGGNVPADAGEYVISVTAGGKTMTRKANILEDVWFDKVY
ncbi:MAG: hypothetical protein NTV05_12685 [Acidobacteria bacterium]|nr:hypothetical protein [Acidobacteriota bacterium]